MHFRSNSPEMRHDIHCEWREYWGAMPDILSYPEAGARIPAANGCRTRSGRLAERLADQLANMEHHILYAKPRLTGTTGNLGAETRLRLPPAGA